MKKTVFIFMLSLINLSVSAATSDYYLEFVNEDKAFLTGVSELLYGEDNSEGHLTQSFYFSYTCDFKTTDKIEYSIELDVFTPKNKEAPSSMMGDRPFAGYLGLGADYITRRNVYNLGIFEGDIIHRLSLDLAVIGPASGGGDFQNLSHSIKGASLYEGWDDQVENKFGGSVSYRINPRIRSSNKYFDIELSPHAVISCSNLINYQGLGASIRIGNKLKSDYGPSIFSPLSNGNVCLRDSENFSWNLFCGFETRHMSSNYLLEGKTIVTDLQTVDKKDFVTDIQAGMIFSFGVFSVNLSLTKRSKEFIGQDDAQQFMRFGTSLSF